MWVFIPRGNQMKIFIVNSQQDMEVCRKFTDALMKRGYEFFADCGIDFGTNIITTIKTGLNDSEVFIAIITENFLNSSWTQAELSSAIFSNYTASCDKLLNSLRDSASLHFTQIARIFSEQEDNFVENYNKLTNYHFAIVLLLFEKDVKVHDNMSIVWRNAFEIAKQAI